MSALSGELIEVTTMRVPAIILRRGYERHAHPQTHPIPAHGMSLRTNFQQLTVNNIRR